MELEHIINHHSFWILPRILKGISQWLLNTAVWVLESDETRMFSCHSFLQAKGSTTLSKAEEDRDDWMS